MIYSMQIVGIIWIAYILNIMLPFEFNQLGVRPRSYEGIPGIFLWCFLHGNLYHIASNTLALLLITPSLFETNNRPKDSFSIIIVISIMSGILTWTVGRNANHMGASGLVYGIIAYLLTVPFFKKDWFNIVISTFVFAGFVLSTIPANGDTIVSHESHLCGLLAGIFAALGFKSTIKKED